MSSPHQKNGALTGLDRVILTRPQTEIAEGSLFCKETAARPPGLAGRVRVRVIGLLDEARLELVAPVPRYVPD